MRAVCGQTVLKFPTPDAVSFEDSLAAARDFILRWKGHSLITPSVSPHAYYTCTPEILRSTAQLAAEFDVPLHTHISETALEVENMRRDNGMPVVPYLKKQGLFDAKVLAAHCTHIDEGEMRTLMHAGAGVAHNPSSNLKLASGFAPIQKMLDLGLDVGIGTDGPASNNDLDMFEEVRLAAFVAKTVSNDPTALPAVTALKMATRLGARALHVGSVTGSLEVGKRADLILVDISGLHNSPRFRRDADTIYSQLVYAGKSTDVTDLMVNGKWLMHDRELLTLDEKAMKLSAQEYAKKIDVFLMAREQSVFSKLVALGGSAEEESFEVQVKVKLEDPAPVLKAIKNTGIEILVKKHYHQHDIYFTFSDPAQGWLRYREDEMVDDKEQITGVRGRFDPDRPLPRRMILRTMCCSAASVILRLQPTACVSTANTSNQPEKLLLTRTACAGWCVTKTRSFSSTWTGSKHLTWVIILKSRAEPGADGMPRKKQIAPRS